MKSLSLLLVLTFSIFLSSCSDSGTEINNDQPEVYLWSHNDYEQPEPLTKALGLGFQMIEADIHLIDGKLYVIHDHPENPDETPLLTEQYLEPLAKIIDSNNGVALPGSKVPFYLVIDVKTEAESTFTELSGVIEPYRQYFTRLENGEWIEGPVRLLISGNRPQLDPESPDRIAFIDGRVPDLGKGYSTDLYPVISDSWPGLFSWNGTGQIPADELEKVRSLVEQAHEEGKLIRFWATADNENVWTTLLDAGVDIINVDDLRGMRDYLDNRQQ